MDLSSLPQVDALLRRPDLAATVARHGRRAVVAAARRVLDEARTTARRDGTAPDEDAVARAVGARLAAARRDRVHRVVNATGVLLHTNLGRAPLSDAAVAAVVEAAGYSSVEYDLERGTRGSRTAAVGELAATWSGAGAAHVVNNGAAALLLVLAATAAGREVVVSRGELIEIGGSYRLPEVVAAAGTRLREVGTTNRTRADDYAAAIGPDTGALLQVHTSNYRVVGFTHAASTRELAAVARQHRLPLVHDLGSGLVDEVRDLAPTLSDEPTIRGVLADGADVVVFSGDKLVGGPQAGVIAGDAAVVARCRSHPLARAVRVDKLQVAALEATLDALLRSDRPLPDSVPLGRMLRTPEPALRQRGESLLAGVGDGPPAVELVPTRAVVGGGAAPGDDLPSWGLRVGGDAERHASVLRTLDPPVVGRIEDGALVLDLRTVSPDDDVRLAAGLEALRG